MEHSRNYTEHEGKFDRFKDPKCLRNVDCFYLTAADDWTRSKERENITFLSFYCFGTLLVLEPFNQALVVIALINACISPIKSSHLREHQCQCQCHR